MGWVRARLRLAVPLYGCHLRKWRTESRDWEQNKQKNCAARRGIPRILLMQYLCPICPTTILIGPFQSTTWNTIVTPRRVPRLTAPRTVPNPRRTGAWFRSCLFMCTLLELFVYQSSLSTLAGAVWKSKDCYGISPSNHYDKWCILSTLSEGYY